MSKTLNLFTFLIVSIVITGIIVYLATRPSSTGGPSSISPSISFALRKCTAQEQYTTQECTQQNLVYALTDKKCYKSGWVNDWVNSECTIINSDTEGGTFSVSVGVITPDNHEVGETQTQYIGPSSSATFKFAQRMEYHDCYCRETSIPKKQVCSTVIKYRTVEQPC